jgi:hypothetical protein
MDICKTTNKMDCNNKYLLCETVIQFICTLLLCTSVELLLALWHTTSDSFNSI